jgi:hypothetical protein
VGHGRYVKREQVIKYFYPTDCSTENDSGLGMDGLESNNDDEDKKAKEKENKKLLVDWLKANPAGPYRFRPRASLVMGISGKVWQCDRCTYWQYSQHQMLRHQRRSH